MANAVNFDDELLTEMLGDFLDESEEILVVLNESLLELDEWVKEVTPGQGTRCDDDLMNEMFRAAHSLKGLSAMLRLDDINVLTHKMENVFDAARNDQLEITQPVVETVFQAVDRLTAMIGCLKDHSDEQIDASQVAEEIQELLDRSGAAKEVLSAEEAHQLLNAGAEAESPTAVEGGGPPEQGCYFADVIDESDIADNYLAIFIDETRQSLDEMSELLVGDPEQAIVEQLMIFCHRIKGSAASIGLHRAAKLAHTMEDLLQERMQDSGQLSMELGDALLACTDALRNHTDQLPGNSTDNEEFEKAFHTLIQAGAAQPSGQQPHVEPVAAESPSGQFADELIAELCQQAANPYDLLLVTVAFEPDFPLIELKAKLLIDRVASSGKLLYCDPAEESLDQLTELSSLALAVEAAGVQDLDAFRHALNAEGVRKLEARRALAEPRAGGQTGPAAVEATPAEIALPEEAEASGAGSKEPAAKQNPQRGRPTETLRVDIDRLDQLMNLAGQLVINKARFVQISDKIRQTAKIKGLAHTVDDVCMRLESLSRHGPETAGGTTVQSVAAQTEQIRGDLESVQAQIASLAEMRFLVNDLMEAVHQLDRVADGIQKSVMDTRMVPIGPLFGRFKRVIRDLTRASGKEVSLEIQGEKTELDKRMIDELGDPLIHMVRNSVDHGIEPPAERLAAGKPRQGTVRLEAFHRGNRIVIRITDDGRGLPLEKIAAKAVAKGLISEADADKLTREQICQLIWHPGFSTAEKVTEVSGRGMGMDIVRAKIEELNGTVELNSTPGEGSTFTIRLPLTMAILPSLLAQIDGDVFAVPVESVVEIVRIKKADLHTVQGRVTAQVRNRIVSVLNLTDVLTWHDRRGNDALSDSSSEVTIVIMGADNLETGMIVHDLIGEEDVVITSMAENYRNIQGIAGASILGDGRVSLILDVAAILSMISTGQCRAAGEDAKENESHLETVA